MELELAKAREIPIVRLQVMVHELVPSWDFPHAWELLELGHALAERALAWAGRAVYGSHDVAVNPAQGAEIAEPFC